MNASDIEIKVYSVGQLRNWLTHGDEDDGLSVAVISRSRADAIVHNPYVKENDPVVAALFAADEKGNRAAVAYTAAFPDLVEGNRKWWFSTLWCHPDYRGKGYALAVVGTLAEEYGEGNYYDSIGADETVEIFRFLKLNTTYVDEYRFGSKVSPHGWKGALNGLRQHMLAYLRTVNRRAKGMIRRSRYELEYTHRVDNEVYNFIMQHASESLFVRTQSMLDWILNHPFKQRSPLEKRVAHPGAFSDTDSRYWMCGVKVLADNRLVGFYILRNADTDLSVKYLYYDIAYRDTVFASVVEHILQMRNPCFSTRHSALAEYVGKLRLFSKKKTVHISFSSPNPLPTSTEIVLQGGDGDGFVCNGSLFITDTTIKCDNIYGHGDETLEYAIVNSCNVALMTIGMQMGITNFINYQQAFGFGSPTGIDLPNENAGVVYNRETMHEVELATCTFGQGFTINMVQEAAAFSTVVNGGNYYQPHVVKQILSADGTSVQTVEPLLLRQPISTAVSKLVRGYLKTAVREGTGRKSQVPGYQTGGKTGTAEKIDPRDGTRWKGHYVVSFIGAAPIDDPKVVLYVVVDEPNVAEQADSSYPQVLFRQIATELFPYMGIYPTEPITDDLLQYLGITLEDTVQNNVKSASFQCFDSSGNLYNDAAINKNGEVIDAAGNVIPGCTADLEKGTVIDGYGNEIEVDISALLDEDIDPTADNPDIASPPEAVEGDGLDDTTWTGAAEDAEEEEE